MEVEGGREVEGRVEGRVEGGWREEEGEREVEEEEEEEVEEEEREGVLSFRVRALFVFLFLSVSVSVSVPVSASLLLVAMMWSSLWRGYVWWGCVFDVFSFPPSFLFVPAMSSTTVRFASEMITEITSIHLTDLLKIAVDSCAPPSSSSPSPSWSPS